MRSLAPRDPVPGCREFTRHREHRIAGEAEVWPRQASKRQAFLPITASSAHFASYRAAQYAKTRTRELASSVTLAKPTTTLAARGTQAAASHSKCGQSKNNGCRACPELLLKKRLEICKL